MRSALLCASSEEGLFLFVVSKRLRAFLNPAFTEKDARQTTDMLSAFTTPPVKMRLERPAGRDKREIKIIFPLNMPRVQRRRPPPAAETGRSCWGSGQQDASATYGTKRMLGAATRRSGGHSKSFFTAPSPPAAGTALLRRRRGILR